jgi:glycosyltransferase involved in cell wall biosynthesis
MRLLHIIAGGEHGGAERFFVDLSTALSARGYQQHAVARSYPERSQSLIEAGCSVTAARMGGPLDVLSGWRTAQAAKKFGPDIVLAWMNRAAALVPRGPWRTVGRLGGYYNLKYYAKCDHLICNTPDLVQHCIRNGWPEDCVDYIPNFSPEVADVEPVQRGAIATPEDAHVLLVLARLEENKAIDVAIAALAALPEVYLWIAGEGSCEHALKSKAESLGVSDRVKFLGWRQDREALLAAADICVVPSRHEPFGNVVVNAWVSGTPLIAAASQGPSYLITNEAKVVVNLTFVFSMNNFINGF